MVLMDIHLIIILIEDMTVGIIGKETDMRCKEHKKYKAIYEPRKTERYPDGCPECWKIWAAKNRKSIKESLTNLCKDLELPEETINELVPELMERFKKEFDLVI
jgi:hypothetical protein